ncbi:MAG TPA: sugar phosphate nucleotidyltransferase, partial [Terriglobia bacterium]|nr:sugar phosphate nucleotidyltransferase [Terriglobia bacterium]
RMAPFGEHYPKPVLPVCNKPLIQHHVEMMKSLGIENILVLIGHKGYQISKVLGDGQRLGVKIRYIEQTTQLGIAHAVGCLEPHLETPFLLFLGDIFFVPGPIQAMFALFEEQGGGAVLATKEEPDPRAIQRNYALLMDGQGFVRRVIEKPRHISNHLKGAGLYLFDLSIFDAIRRTPRTAMRDEYELTDSIQILIDDGYPVRPCNAILDDINLTTAADLLFCNLLQAKKLSPEERIGNGVRIHEGATLTDCVVGHGVTISHPIAISESVILDDTRVEGTAPIQRHILTPEGSVDCAQGLLALQQRLGA